MNKLKDLYLDFFYLLYKSESKVGGPGYFALGIVTLYLSVLLQVAMFGIATFGLLLTSDRTFSISHFVRVTYLFCILIHITHFLFWARKARFKGFVSEIEEVGIKNEFLSERIAQVTTRIGIVGGMFLFGLLWWLFDLHKKLY